MNKLVLWNQQWVVKYVSENNHKSLREMMVESVVDARSMELRVQSVVVFFLRVNIEDQPE
jgi:hypothetical protein